MQPSSRYTQESRTTAPSLTSIHIENTPPATLNERFSALAAHPPPRPNAHSGQGALSPDKTINCHSNTPTTAPHLNANSGRGAPRRDLLNSHYFKSRSGRTSFPSARLIESRQPLVHNTNAPFCLPPPSATSSLSIPSEGHRAATPRHMVGRLQYPLTGGATANPRNRMRSQPSMAGDFASFDSDSSASASLSMHSQPQLSSQNSVSASQPLEQINPVPPLEGS
jgi:hypothetical protein